MALSTAWIIIIVVAVTFMTCFCCCSYSKSSPSTNTAATNDQPLPQFQYGVTVIPSANQPMPYTPYPVHQQTMGPAPPPGFINNPYPPIQANPSMQMPLPSYDDAVASAPYVFKQ